MATSATPRPGSKRARAAARQKAARRRRNLGIAGGVAGAIGLVVVAVVAFSGAPDIDGVTERESWDLPALEADGRITLADFRGKPTVAAFFASWCEICRAELPGFAALSRQTQSDVYWVGIDMMDNGGGLPLAQATGIDIWPLARDVGGLDGRGLATAFGARGSPMTVLYDAGGRVVDVTLGGMSAATLAQKLDSLFGVGA